MLDEQRVCSVGVFGDGPHDPESTGQTEELVRAGCGDSPRRVHLYVIQDRLKN